MILGLDLSLTETGYYLSDGKKSQFGVFKTKLKGVQRLLYLEEQLKTLLTTYEVTQAVIEGYAYMANGRTFDIGEWGGIARLTLYKHRVPFTVVAPATLKKYATGKGNADKKTVMAAVKDKWGFETKNNNVADAFVLYKLGGK